MRSEQFETAIDPNAENAASNHFGIKQSLRAQQFSQLKSSDSTHSDSQASPFGPNLLMQFEFFHDDGAPVVDNDGSA